MAVSMDPLSTDLLFKALKIPSSTFFSEKSSLELSFLITLGRFNSALSIVDHLLPQLRHSLLLLTWESLPPSLESTTLVSAKLQNGQCIKYVGYAAEAAFKATDFA